jgi:hypothetical protein
MAEYGQYGGAVMITDPKNPSKSNTIIKEPLGKQAVTGLALGPDAVYLSTSLEGNGVKTNPVGTPQVGALDIKTHKVLWKTPSPTRVTNLLKLTYDAQTKTLGMIGGGKLLLLDSETHKFKTDVPAKTANETLDLLAPGKFVYGDGNDVVVFDLNLNKEISRIKTPIKVERLATAKDGTIYISGGPAVYQVKL